MMKNCFCITIILILIVAGMPAYADYTLNVSVYNEDGTPAGSITFPGVGDLALVGNLWIVSPQYLRVRYGSHETNWYVRVITKNHLVVDGIYPKPLAVGPDRQWEWIRLGIASYQNVGGVYQTGDDIVSYGGLINPATKDNPNARASLAWQVFRFSDPYNPPPPGHIVTPHTTLNDGTVGGGPIDDWAYIGDVRDTGYVSDPTHEYFWVAYGSGGFALLSQHPVVYWQDNNHDGIPDRDASGSPIALPKPGGVGICEMVIYFGARFGLKAADGVTDIAVLPAGNYISRIYLELIHE